MAYLPDLERLLTPGYRYGEGRTALVLNRHRLDDVVLPSGRVVACDPLSCADGARPFTVSVPPGTYPLWAWVALITGPSGFRRRVAALQLVVAGVPAQHWEPAVLDGQDVAQLDADGYFGYPVDAGCGTLADIIAVRTVSAWDYERIEDVFIPTLVPEDPVPGAIGAVVDRATGANVVLVNSGRGEGIYPTFTGYADDGTLAAFVTDFLVVPAPAMGASVRGV
jgi:hypothetical protein